MKKNTIAAAMFVLLGGLSAPIAEAGNSCAVDVGALSGFKVCAVDPYWVELTLVQIHFCETFPNWESGFDNCSSAGIEPAKLSLSAGDSVTLSSATKPASGTYKYVVEVYGPETGVQADIVWDADVWMRSDDPTDPAQGGKYCWTTETEDRCGPTMGNAEKQVANRTGYSENDHCPVMQVAVNPTSGQLENGRFYCSRNTGASAIDAPLNENEYQAGTYNGFTFTGIVTQGSLDSLARSASPGNETFGVAINYKATPIVITDDTTTLTYDVKLTGSAGSSYTAQNMYNAGDPAVSAWLYDNPNNEYVLNNITNLGLDITITAN